MLAMSKRLNFKRFCVDLVCTVLPSENTDYCYCVLGLICLFLMLILFYEATNRKKFNIFFHFSRELQKKNHIRRLLHSTNFFVLHSKIIFVHLHRIESHAITNQNLFLGSRAAASQSFNIAYCIVQWCLLHHFYLYLLHRSIILSASFNDVEGMILILGFSAILACCESLEIRHFIISASFNDA